MSSRVRGGMARGIFWTTSIQQSHPARLGAWWDGVSGLCMESVMGQTIRLWSIEQGQHPLNHQPQDTALDFKKS